MPNPSDLARLDARLQRFWKRYGCYIDCALIAGFLAAVAWCVGYLTGLGTR
jgi:hypothetical protein